MKLYNCVLQHQPNNPDAKKDLRRIPKNSPQNQAAQIQPTNPAQDQINALINLYHTGQLSKTEQVCRELVQTYPQSLIISNELGAALKGRESLRKQRRHSISLIMQMLKRPSFRPVKSEVSKDV